MTEPSVRGVDLQGAVELLDQIDPDEIRTQLARLDGEKTALSRLLHVVLGRRRARLRAEQQTAMVAG